MRTPLALWCLSLCLFALPSAVRAQPSGSPFSARYRQSLEAAGVHTDRESLAAFLKLHHIGPEQEQTYARLIAELGHDDFFVREAATAGLLQLATQAAGVIKEASQSSDPEVRWRAEFILNETSKPRSDLLYAALVVIQAESIPGLAGSLLKAGGSCQNEYLRLALARALEATVTPADIPLLTEAVVAQDAITSLAAFQALLSIADYDPTGLAERLLKEGSDPLKIAAAEWLLKSGSRPAIDALGRLLDSEDVAIRNRSAQLLQGVLKTSLKYSAYAEPDERRTQSTAVRALIVETLDHRSDPVVPKFSGADLGRVLVCSYKGDQLFEIDGLGQKVNPLALTGVADCQLLPEGRRLVSQVQRMRVVELDAAGQEIWKLEGLQGYPIRMRRLPNGETTVVTIQGELQRLDVKGQKLWSSRFEGAQPRDLHHLPNGHLLLLFSRSRQIVELNDRREETWRSPALEQVLSVCPTQEGTYLVATLKDGTLLELNREGGTRPFACDFTRPQQIQQLRDGRFLVLDAAGLHLLTRTGQRVRTVLEAENLTRFDAADAVDAVLP
jgi:HEAT repeat protein